MNANKAKPMNATEIPSEQSQLMIAVFDKLELAKQGATALQDAGLLPRNVQVINQPLTEQMPDGDQLGLRETTSGSIIAGSQKWGVLGLLLGAMIGVIASIIFSNMIIGVVMALVAGLTGVWIGSISGMEHATLDDSVDLPTTEEYRQLMTEGCALLSVRGSPQDLIFACETLSQAGELKVGLRSIHGHVFHKYRPFH
jgi:hypothetical protein